MSNKTYDVLKYIVQYILPGISTLYFTLSAIWNLPYAEQIMGTIAAVCTFLGISLGISTKKYKDSDEFRDGIMTFVNGDKPNIKLNTSAEELKEKQIVSLRIEKGENDK